MGVLPILEWPEQAWREVLAGQTDPHPFATGWWQRAWWESFATGRPAVLSVLDVEASGSAGPAGVLALRADGDDLLPLGSRELTDYPGPAVAPGRAADAAELMLAASGATPCRRLVLDNQRPADPFTAAVAAAAASAGLPLTEQPDEAVAILTLPSAPDPDVWWRGLDRHTRHELARKRRRLHAAHPHVQIRSSTRATLDADLDAFLTLHRSAAGAKGSFMTAGHAAFIRRLAGAAEAAGWLALDVLAEPEGPPLAAALGFASADSIGTYYLYNMAYDRRAAAVSPGLALVVGLIERAIGSRRPRIDFLRGLERYKLELGAAPERLVRLEVGLR